MSADLTTIRLTMTVREGPIEITDLLWPVDAHGRRLPVRRAEAIDALRGRGQHHAVRLVSRLPHADGELDPQELGRLGVRIHRELQRLHEELQMDRRVAALLVDHLAVVRAAGEGPLRVVDVGCGLGGVLRAAAAHRSLAADVELVGVDLNPVLVDEARRLAAAERLPCRFVLGDALAPGVAVTDPARTFVISTGMLHHLSTDELAGLFAAQSALGIAGFAHWDIAPCLWSTLGAWLFHQARMREPISRHDGVLSARRAHPTETLLRIARAVAPEYQPTVLEGGRWQPRALDVLRPIVGWRA